MFQKSVDKDVVIDHIQDVMKEKTIQLTDHLINKATLEKKLSEIFEMPEEAQKHYENLMKTLAGKNQSQHEKFVAKLEDNERVNLQDYINHKRNLENLEYAKKGIIEHEEFLYVLDKLKATLINE